MKFIKLSLPVILFTLFLIGCNTEKPRQTAISEPTQNNRPVEVATNDYWAKDNLDLQRVGNLLERSKDPQEFEKYLNSNDGINNLDLNGDGYVDYIGVQEYQDRNDNERGLSLFSRFGPDLIQEIAQIVLFREDPRSAGARVFLRGNEQIYGDNNYYETNWADRTVGLVSTLFGNRNEPYRSPYYYDNYPSTYQTYQVVDTPYYRTRIEQLYPQPMFINVGDPIAFGKFKIKSPNNGLHLGQIKARLVKPTKDQEEFYKNNPRDINAARINNDNNRNDKDKGSKDEGGMKNGKMPKDENPGNADKNNDRRNETPGINPSKPEKTDKQDRNKQDGDKGNGKPSKPEKSGGNEKGNDKGGDKGKGKP